MRPRATVESAALQVVKNLASSSPWQLLPSLAKHYSYMHTQNIDYAAIKNRLKSLQPKNRADTRYAHLAELKEELRDARKRGVSVNTLSAELKAAGIVISAASLAKYLSRRTTSAPAKRNTASIRAPQARAILSNNAAPPPEPAKTK